MRILPLIVLASALVLPFQASAQWQWIDKDGRKVFSDKAPPPDVPEKSILHSGAPLPRQAASTPAQVNADAPLAEPKAAAEPAVPKAPVVDKELQEKTRKAEEEEKAKRAAEEQKVTKAKAENCARARQAKATLDSGMRVARMNDKGERVVMDDAARAAEQQRMQSVIAADCGGPVQ